jgi:hypothetical protein
METGLQNFAGNPVHSNVSGMAGIPAAPSKDIAGKRGHDDREKCAGQDEKGLNHVDEIADTRVRYHVNIAQQMIPTPHADRKNQSSVNMLEAVGL